MSIHLALLRRRRGVGRIDPLRFDSTRETLDSTTRTFDEAA